MTRAAEILDDDPITLGEASRVVLRGRVTVSALRAEIRRGNLAVEKIGKNLYTTPAAVREMRERCRVKPSPQGSIPEKTSAATSSGSSATTGKTNELDALLQTAKALKSGSLTTSRKNTPRDPRKVESPIPFPSRRS